MKKSDQLYIELQQRAERLGYFPPLQLGKGNSQTYEFQLGNRAILLIAFRDVGLKLNYSRPDRLWVEGLDIALDRYAKLSQQNAGEPLPPAVAVVTDNIGEAYVVVRLNDLFDLYLYRIRNNLDPESRKFTFVLIRRSKEYFLQMPRGEPEVRLSTVNSMRSIITVLQRSRGKAIS
jgi:hypothetical protein